MAEPESILQLGIEAARENKKEEARQLFRLLTRQEPNNAQGWLWLAGVAENREERQAALERVLELDPDNEMALKGLQALGIAVAPVAPPPPVVSEPPVAPGAPAPAPVASPYGDDDSLAELDNLSDAIAADTSGPVRRAEGEPVEAAAVATGAAAAAAVGTTTRGADRATGQAPPSRRTRYPEEDELEPARRGISPLLALLLFLVGLGLIGLLIAFLFPGIFGGNLAAPGTAGQTTAAQTEQASLAPTTGPILGGSVATPAPGVVPTAGPAVLPTAEPGVVPTAEPGVVPTAEPGVVPTAEPGVVPTTAPAVLPTAPPADVSGANPAIVPANTPLQSEGWLYDFNQPTFAASIIGNLGRYSPQNGRFVVVLAYAVNNTGTTQAVPASFFVLKDAQGRVWEARPEVSEAYVVPGINADLPHTASMPSDGVTRSVAIVFDVAPDATDLVFFARSNPGQGWIVLRSV